MPRRCGTLTQPAGGEHSRVTTHALPLTRYHSRVTTHAFSSTVTLSLLSWNYKSSAESMKRVNCGRVGRYVTVVVRDETKAIRYISWVTEFELVYL